MKLLSPVGVLSNAVNSVTDLVASQIKLREQIGVKTECVSFNVGTQINGVPHIGTFLTHACAFKLAEATRKKFNQLAMGVEFVALDNAPHDFQVGKNGQTYQRTYAQLDKDGFIDNQIDKSYRPFFNDLLLISGVGYNITKYSDQQKDPIFRNQFLNSLRYIDQLSMALAPASGVSGIRLPYTKDGYAEKKPLHTRLLSHDSKCAIFECQNIKGKTYRSKITGHNGHEQFLDLNTLYRNVIKEAALAQSPDTLHVMVKGTDWSLATPLVDQGLNILGLHPVTRPVRIYTPLVVTGNGAKLSKTLLRENPALMKGVPAYMLDMSRLKEEFSDYAGRVCRFVDLISESPNDFFRAYDTKTIDRVIQAPFKPER